MSHLRVHVDRLNVILANMEDNHRIDGDFLCDSLGDIESDIRQFRRLLGKVGFQEFILGGSLFLKNRINRGEL